MATALDFHALLRAERRKARKPKQIRNANNAPALSNQSMLRAAAVESGPSSNVWGPERPIKIEPKSRSLDLDRYKVSGPLADSIFYVPDFLTATEGADLLCRLDEMPSSCWTDLRRRRLQNHGGTPHPDGMHPLPVPCFVEQLFGLLVSAGIFPKQAPPNHALINSYRPGEGISPHQDGPLYQPLVGIISLDGPAVLQFWHKLADTKGGDPVSSVLCLPNSLLVFKGDAYNTHWHGISEVSADVLAEHTGNMSMLGKEYHAGHMVLRGTRRVSLTLRRVLHVHPVEKQIVTAAAREEQKRKDEWWLQGINGPSKKPE